VHRAVVDGRDAQILQRPVGEQLVHGDEVGAEREEARVVLHPGQVARVLQQHRLGGLVEHGHHARHVGQRLVDAHLVARPPDHQSEFRF
jgi:hypothetical protein